MEEEEKSAWEKIAAGNFRDSCCEKGKSEKRQPMNEKETGPVKRRRGWSSSSAIYECLHTSIFNHLLYQAPDNVLLN